MDAMSTDHGWVSYGAGDNSHLTDEQRRLVEERKRQREEARGQLLCIVQVYVYEQGAEPQVSFPHDAVMGVESDQADVRKAVSRARDALGDWL